MFSGEREGKELTQRDQNGANGFSFHGCRAFSSLVVFYSILKSSLGEKVSHQVQIAVLFWIHATFRRFGQCFPLQFIPMVVVFVHLLNQNVDQRENQEQVLLCFSFFY